VAGEVCAHCDVGRLHGLQGNAVEGWCI
jgi:hypothetical protein